MIKKHIPNAITLINLFLGSCAVVAVLDGQFLTSFYLIFFAGLADWMDGGVARSLKVSSSIGKELDSLADMVSFGLVPGAILYVLLFYGLEGTADIHFSWLAAPAFLVTVFSGLRLAKFNIDERQTENFIGMATPTVTMFMLGLMLIYHFDYFGLRDLVTNQWFLYLVIGLFSWLLNAEISMFSFKLKSLKWAGNEIRFIFIAVSMVLLIVLKGAAFSVIVLLYLLINLVLHFLNNKTVRKM